jgi:hypothetical protein
MILHELVHTRKERSHILAHLLGSGIKGWVQGPHDRWRVERGHIEVVEGRDQVHWSRAWPSVGK